MRLKFQDDVNFMSETLRFLNSLGHKFEFSLLYIFFYEFFSDIFFQDRRICAFLDAGEKKEMCHISMFPTT